MTMLNGKTRKRQRDDRNVGVQTQCRAIYLTLTLAI